MKQTITYLAILALVISARAAFGQTGFSETVTTFSENGSGNPGSDFWFAPIQNDIDGTGKSIKLYITSLVNTTASIEFDGMTTSTPVVAGSAATFNVPLAWELKSSGIVENKAIHVWCSNANISVYLMSHSTAGGDGMCCIPTQGLGKDYVVAGYESVYEGFGSSAYDFPSEFTISAEKDSTIVEITPSTDLRISTAYPSDSSQVAFPKGQKFSVMLNAGQAVQYQAVQATDADNFDVTGTVIHSNNPVGVVAGAMAANIPPAFPYADYICDMIPPIREWGKTYYATNTNPAAGTTDDFNTYCFISSVPNQTIDTYNPVSGKIDTTTLGPAYDHFYYEGEGANKFYSNAPFLLVQYINSSTYPDGNTNNTTPAEVVIDPKENFTKTVIFEIPSSVGAQSPFDAYASVTFNINDAKNVLIDGKSISSFTRQDIDSVFAIVIVPHLVPAAHEVTSDSGVGVSIYGYGTDESYALAGSLGTRFSNDTVPPNISFTKDSLCLHILLSDTGSGLDVIYADSASNVTLSFDSSFVPGNAQSYADLCVIDPFQSGYLHLIVTDLADNTSIATIIYTHPPIVSAPGFALTSVSFDTVLVGTEKTLPILVVTDTSTQFPITIDKIGIDASEFIFNSNIAANQLPITLAPLSSHNFIVTFNPAADSAYACIAAATSNADNDHTTIERVDTLRGIGYSFPAGVANESQNKFYITLTPNPATNSAQLNFTLPQTADVTFELSSMDGKTVFRWNAYAESIGEHVQTLDISSLPTASYIYSFNANGQTISGKLIINR